MLKDRKKFWKAEDGLAAMEFAFIAPVLVALLVGTVELCSALECNQKVGSVASSVADLVAQTASVSSADITNIFAAGNFVIYPFPSANTSIVISSIVNSTLGNASTNKVCWSEAQNGTALAKGTVVNVPAGVVSTGGSAILVQVSYTYSSPIAQMFFSSLPMASTFYAHPRESAQVVLNSTPC